MEEENKAVSENNAPGQVEQHESMNSNEHQDSEKKDRKMYPAKCSDCGAECEVPFEPTEGKKVRCNECFRKNRPRRQFKKHMYDATCSKCNSRCKVPFRPNGSKPILCRDCYQKTKE